MCIAYFLIPNRIDLPKTFATTKPPSPLKYGDFTLPTLLIYFVFLIGLSAIVPVSGLSEMWDLIKMVRFIKKAFACNGTVINHSEYGQVIQLQGDQRSNMSTLLIEGGFASREQVKVHGF